MTTITTTQASSSSFKAHIDKMRRGVNRVWSALKCFRPDVIVEGKIAEKADIAKRLPDIINTSNSYDKASGIGLAAAKALAARGDWSIHLIDINKERGPQAVAQLGRYIPQRRRVRLYLAFLRLRKHLQEHTGDGPPPEPNYSTMDVNLRGAMNMAYLALHYFKHSKGYPKDANLLFTASSAGVYFSEASPIYSASKHGVIGLMQALNGAFFDEDEAAVPAQAFTPTEIISNVVTTLIDGGELVDSKDLRVEGANLRGHSVEFSGENFYIRGAADFSDPLMEAIVGYTSLKAQKGGLVQEGL
ncbi:hypothetical protein AJ80_01935 [Polytolypa hystricis UAMH7299]|uniref:NAD(P)-binding protein n=1 Tax=Polytolypa hystricis (strain UAMH7299) TaxID=1447883 RepID=A0A2B7Z0T7_POLH7|nr:hypothetical protein AJ80_01935 [Polytolypa hystricis UAMH7299]